MNPALPAMIHAFTDVLTFSRPNFSQKNSPNHGVLANSAQKFNARNDEYLFLISHSRCLFSFIDPTKTHYKPITINFSQ